LSRLSHAPKKSAKPKSMLAVTAICPTRLNQPVNQLHAAPFLRASLAD
jgi:hypothetical protein